jgi:hypothetical protein
MSRILQKTLVKRFISEAIITGNLPCDFYGTVKQIHAFSEALFATREFDRILNESDNLENVTKALKVKRAAAARFRKEFDLVWPA